jgi:membrane fusion protein, copper/silver efflux system
MEHIMNKQKLTIVLAICGGLTLGILGFVLGKGMSSSNETPSSAQVINATPKVKTTWTCSMHPQIKLKKPGKCPICGMALIPLKSGGANLGDREIKLSPLAEKLASIEVMPAIRKEFYMSVPMVGKVSLDETRSKKITARYAGRVDRLFVDYTGIQVKKGDHLFEIYSPQLINAQEELSQAIESAKAMQNSSIESIRKSSLKAVDASRDKLRLWGLTDSQIKTFEKTKIITDHVTTYSPMEGVVVKKHVDEGSYLKEGSSIYSIASLDYLWIELDAYESDLQWLHYAQEVVFTTEAWPGEEFKGRVSFIHPLLNDKTRTVKVRVNVENKDRRLKPDMFVRAEVRVNVNASGKVIDHALAGKWISPMHPEVISDKPGPCTVCGMDLVPAHEYGFSRGDDKTENPLLIPASAPLITGKRAVVYVKSLSKEGVYQGRTITLGLKAGDYYIVKSGLRQGDLVVTKGAFKIDSALQIQAKPSMMSLESKEKQLSLPTSIAFKKSLSKIYDTYDIISKELSKDSIKALKHNAEILTSTLKEIKVDKEESKTVEFWQSKSKEIELSLNVLKSSTSLKSARKNFETLSIAMIETVQILGTLDDINLAFCSMAFNDKGAYWLQKSSEVENPYFGSQMFHCGDIKKKFSHQVKVSELSEKNQALLTAAFDDYLKVTESLSTDKNPDLAILQNILKKVQSINMNTMSEEVHLSLMKEVGVLKDAIEPLTPSSGLKVVRQQFSKVSKSIISLMKMFSFLKKDSFVLNCPMAFDGKGAAWLQLNKEPKNPYLGMEMQKCGDLKEEFKARLVKTKDPHKGHKMKTPVAKPKKSLPVQPKKDDADMHKHHQHKETPEIKKESPKKKPEVKPEIPRELLNIYLKAQKALSQDRFPDNQFDALTQSIKPLKPDEKLSSALKKMYSSQKIAEVRSSFAELSNFLIDLSKRSSFDQDLNLAHCPMAFKGKGGYWLQISDKVENPYFGSMMYRCGEVKKKFTGSK